ncbi:uncharacterized protein LOC120086918 [Benincasa hispida]|uniref:uncharacterized protein LOC120086918 n=1 Tax=Benincasa hispida TaxID=102211 RepID=UPI0019029A68|nr:uncharacterized protein LOC120086918 [Benincasa hispida]
MDSTDMEFDGTATDTSKNKLDVETDANTSIVDIDSANKTSDIPNLPKRGKVVKKSMVWDHFERLKDCNWRLHRRILSLCPIENHEDDTIGKTIEKNLKDLGIERVMTLTVDNASSNDTAIAYLLKRFNKGLLFGREFLHVRCCAHILNLTVAMKFEKAFDRLEDEDASYRHDFLSNKEDWTNAKMLIRILKNCIRLNAGSANAMLVEMANSMKAKFEKYWGNNEKNNLLLYVAIVLDPRKKLRCRFHEYSTQSGSGSTTTNTPIVSTSETIIYCDPIEKMGQDFVYDTVDIDFEGNETTSFEQGSEIDIYLLEASESAFSTRGLIVDSSHCSLDPKRVEALICTQNWLHSNPIDLEVQHDLKEASLFEEGFRVIMDDEKEVQDLPDFAKLSLID